MKLEYKRELDHNYMILEEDTGMEKEGYEIYMLEENRIPGLLKCTMQRTDQRRRFCYEVTSRQTLELLLERKRLAHGDLLQLLKGIRRAVAGAREYLLDVNHLLIMPEYMYLNVDKGIPEFCYFPYYEKPIREQFFDLAEYLLGKLDRQDRAGVELGYEIYKMAGEDNCSLDEILRSEIARGEALPLSAEKVRLFQEPAANQSKLRIAEDAGVYETNAQKRSFWGRKKKMIKPQKVSEETDSLRVGEELRLHRENENQREEMQVDQGFEGGTRLLSEGLGRGLLLYSMNAAAPPLIINEDSFLIGKKRDAVDGYIDHPAVSRIHARIEKREQGYYLVDLNSTNGTYMNEKMLGMNERVKLNAGDVVRFGTVEYSVDF